MDANELLQSKSSTTRCSVEFYGDSVSHYIDANELEFYVHSASLYIDASKFLLRKILPTRCFSGEKQYLRERYYTDFVGLIPL